MEVISVRIYAASDTYAECPACQTPLEREYVNYCSYCGQRLAWNQFCKGNVKVRYCEAGPTCGHGTGEISTVPAGTATEHSRAQRTGRAPENH